jgi:hydrogenase small subunit
LVKELPVIYLQTAACSGCAVSLLNSASPTIKDFLIDQVVPGVHINLRFHPVIMAGAGEMVIKVLEDTAKEKKDGQGKETGPDSPPAQIQASGELERL